MDTTVFGIIGTIFFVIYDIAFIAMLFYFLHKQEKKEKQKIIIMR